MKTIAEPVKFSQLKEDEQFWCFEESIGDEFTLRVKKGHSEAYADGDAMHSGGTQYKHDETVYRKL